MSKSNVVADLSAATQSLSLLSANRFERIRHVIGDARVVLIGEETHGTHEFYALRAELTKALIEKEHFSLVLCESDFPAFYKLHRFVGGTQASQASLASSSSAGETGARPSTDRSKVEAASVEQAEMAAAQSRMTVDEVMEGLKERFPVWMWRNQVVKSFVEWLQHENLGRGLHKGPNSSRLPVALFGLDIYSLFSSTDQVIGYLDAVDPSMAARARQRYSVLQQYRPHEGDYCRAVLRGQVPPQHTALRRMLDELNDKANEFKNVFGDGDEYFNAHENARIILAAEEYYRQSYFGSSVTWNLRDTAMVDLILDALQLHDEKLAQAGYPHERSRAIVWAHNSHIGDATATEQYHTLHQVNVGHLVRKQLGQDQCFLIGQSTYQGTVRAARRWNGKDSVMELNPSLPDSTGAYLHAVTNETKSDSFGIVFRSNNAARPLTWAETRASAIWKEPRLERFVGVQYMKHTERQSHYSMCALSDQFDMILHCDVTSALQPLPDLWTPGMPVPTTSVRPGTVDYSKWDKLVEDEEDE